MNMPKHINGMEVVQCGMPSARGLATGPSVMDETGSVQTVTNVAICRRPNQIGYCVVFCLPDWTCVTTEFDDTLFDAQLSADNKFDTDIQWHYPEFAVARYFPIAQKYLAFSIIVGILLPALDTVGFVGPLLLAIAAIAAGILFLVSLSAIWLLVGYIGIRKAGWLYGSCHLLLVILLTPAGLLGPLLIPYLITSDLSRWREWEEDQRNPSRVQLSP